MSESLIQKYPHLKNLVEDETRRPTSHSAVEGKIPGKSLLGTGHPRPVPVKTSQSQSQSQRPVGKARAEELFVRSQGADRDHWLGFQIQESLSAKQQEELLQLWLVTNKPSKVDREAGVGWITVKLGSYARRVKSAEAKAEWKGSKEERTMDTVNNLAAKYGDTGGKWLFHVTVDLVDKCWESLALVMLSGGLGPNVSMIKVSPRGEEDSHVIIVYNDDYQDSNQVMRIENLLRSAGVKADLLYKPDIFSTLGIYRNNIWGFRPTIYSSKVTRTEGMSRITVAGTGKWYSNSSHGMEVKGAENLSKIVADISRPDPKVFADPKKDDLKGEKKPKDEGKKVDRNGNNKKEECDENKNYISKVKEKYGSGLIKEFSMLDMKSLDELA